MRNQRADPALVMIVVILMGLVTVRYLDDRSADPGRDRPGPSTATMLPTPS